MIRTRFNPGSAPSALLFLWLMFGAAAAVAETGVAQSYQLLEYEAVIAGAPAGSARVAFARAPIRKDPSSAASAAASTAAEAEAEAPSPVVAERYRLVGEAKAEGLLDALSPWKTNFWVSGERADLAVSAVDYRYIEKGRSKRRDVHVSDATLKVIKNGRQRAPRAALPGMDVISALFAVAACPPSLMLHTGRHGYRLQAVGAGADTAADVRDIRPGRCRYRVTDEDDDQFDIDIEFETLAGARVPSRIEVAGTVTGTLALKRSTTRSESCDVSASVAYLCGVQNAAPLAPATPSAD